MKLRNQAFQGTKSSERSVGISGIHAGDGVNKDDYLRIARESGLRFHTTGSPSVAIECVSGYTKELLAFASAIAALEREECAKVCDELAKDGGYCDGPGPKSCAAAIRNKDTK
jgi:hypothetical protein